MPLNERKIIAIITGEIRSVEERCPGYRQELTDTIAEIMEYERQHRLQGTNIQQRINDKCAAAGRFLVDAQQVKRTLQ